jgi:TetR/AcrR family transcriptional repressor of nem operon
MNKKHSREDILEKAQEIIKVRGFNNTGVNDILKAAEIPKGSFYNFFSSKEEFGIHLLDYYGEKSLKFIEEFLSNPTESPLNRLKSFYQYLVDSPETSKNFGGCLVYNMASEMGMISDALAEATNRNFMLWVDRIAICVKEAQEQEEISRSFDPKELAEYMHMTISGSMARAKVTRSSVPLQLTYNNLFNYIESR